MKNKIFIVLIFSIICGFSKMDAQVQNYKHAIGLRLGYPLSISYKRFISDKGAFEAILGYRNYSYFSWLNFGVLYEHHMPINSVEGLAYYFGGGASIYKWTYDKVFYPNNDYAGVSFGIVGCLGLDYRFKDIPLNLSIDWLPTVALGGEFNTGFGASYGGLAVRYILK
ncbi:MAG: hypothetical protein ABIO44_09850 [Saprospiraceae bacterium]